MSMSSNRIVLAVLGLVVLAAALFAMMRWSGGSAKADDKSGTPRTADGHPDLTGYWGRLKVDAPPQLEGISDETIGEGTVDGFAEYITAFEKDSQLGQRLQVNRPVYRTDLWEKVRTTDWNYSRKYDPQVHCNPGLPRLGIPNKIVQLPNEIIFFYEIQWNSNRFRIIPIDGRGHNPHRSNVPSWLGDPVGHWDGDTLVVETVGLNDEGWLGPTGYFHSDQIKVIERLKRDGNALTMETVVEDPVLLQPWHMDNLTAKLNNNPQAILWDETCDERDKQFVGNPNEGR